MPEKERKAKRRRMTPVLWAQALAALVLFAFLVMTEAVQFSNWRIWFGLMTDLATPLALSVVAFLILSLLAEAFRDELPRAVNILVLFVMGGFFLGQIFVNIFAFFSVSGDRVELEGLRQLLMLGPEFSPRHAAAVGSGALIAVMSAVLWLIVAFLLSNVYGRAFRKRGRSSKRGAAQKPEPKSEELPVEKKRKGF